MSDPNEPPRPDDSGTGSGDAPAPPPPPPGNQPYGAADGGQPDYGQNYPQGSGWGQPGGQPAYGAPAEQPGGLGTRFLARLIDGVLLGIVAAIPTSILAAIFDVSSGGLGYGGSYAYAAIAGIITAVLDLGYFGYLESTRGQTVGKMALKLHVQSMSGGLPTFEQALKRNAWLGLPILGVIPVVGSLIGSLGQLAAVIAIIIGIAGDSVARRPWTDKYAETRVLRRAA